MSLRMLIRLVVGLAVGAIAAAMNAPWLDTASALA
jgi:hypothetical protein